MSEPTFTVLRLSGPLMAWPASAKHRQRFTETGPTYSALVGLLAAAAGVPRGADLPAFLRDARMAARLDRPGELCVDFHTINPRDLRNYWFLSEKDRKAVQHQVATADGGKYMDPVRSHRHYRADQVVTVLVEDPEGLVADAVLSPRWSIFAGRKSCVLDFPIFLGRFTAPSLEEAVRIVPVVDASVPEGASVSCHVIFYQVPESQSMVVEEVVHDDLPGSVGQGWGYRSRFVLETDVPAAASLDALVRFFELREGTLI